jgi:hypothetical protein
MTETIETIDEFMVQRTAGAWRVYRQFGNIQIDYATCPNPDAALIVANALNEHKAAIEGPGPDCWKSQAVSTHEPQFTLAEIEAALQAAAHRPSAIAGAPLSAHLWKSLILDELAGPDRPGPAILNILSDMAGVRANRSRRIAFQNSYSGKRV